PCTTLFRSPLGAARLGRDHDQRGQAGDLVHLARHRDAFLDVGETDRAVVFGHDGARQRIPGGQLGAGLDDVAVAHGDGGAVGHLVAFALAAVVVIDDDFAGTGHRDAVALGGG